MKPYETISILLAFNLTFRPPASMDRFSSDVLPVIFRGLPFSKRKIAMIIVCSKWRSAMLMPQSHEVLHEGDDSAEFKQGDLSVSLLAVLPVANCPARFVAGGLEHIQKAFIALPGTLCYESGERWSVQCWNGIFPLVRELHFDNEADWLVDSVPIPSLVSFPRLSLLNLDWSYDSSTALPEIAQPLPSDCQVVLHMMSDYVEVAFHKLKNTGLQEVLTRLELVDFMEQEEGNEGCSISISLLSSFRRLEEIVIHLVEAYETGPYMIKDLFGMGPNFKRAMVDLDGRDEGEWHVQFTSGWKAYTGVDERGQLRLFVERV